MLKFKDKCQQRHCPSELLLDQCYLGELSKEEVGRLEGQIAQCAGCQQRMEERKTGAPGFSLIDTDSMIDRVCYRLQQDRSFCIKRWFNTVVRTVKDVGVGFQHSYRLGLSMGVIAAVLMLSIVPRGEDFPSIQRKGTPLKIYRERSGEVRLAESGDIFHQGDRIRFVVSGVDTAEAMIVSFERDGSRSVYYPQAGHRSKPLLTDEDGALPGAIVLDDYLGEEQLFLVACERPFEVSDVRLAPSSTSLLPSTESRAATRVTARSGGMKSRRSEASPAADSLVAPKQCSTYPFVIVKE